MNSGNNLVDNMGQELNAPDEPETFCDVCEKHTDECICMTFENYLVKVFTDQYKGTKEYFEDDLDCWLELLDIEDMKRFADSYGEFMLKRGMKG